jgi:hypothetical protein
VADLKRSAKQSQRMLTELRQLPEAKKKMLQYVVILPVLLPWSAFMLYGFARWPYAPIREVAGRYLDKRDHSFSSTEFISFQKWEQISSWGVPVVSCAFVLAWTIGRLSREKKA